MLITDNSPNKMKNSCRAFLRPLKLPGRVRQGSRVEVLCTSLRISLRATSNKIDKPYFGWLAKQMIIPQAAKRCQDDCLSAVLRGVSLLTHTIPFALVEVPGKQLMHDIRVHFVVDHRYSPDTDRRSNPRLIRRRG